MSAPRLRDALASLQREHSGAPVSLTREAERSIRRRVARRWAGGAAAVTAAGALAFAGGNALVSATNAAGAASSLAPTPTASESPVPSVAHIPLAGGPEFTSINDYPICGQPAPQPQPSAQGFSIAASVGASVDSWPNQSVEALTASVKYEGDDPGTSTRGPVWVVLLRDGNIAGATQMGGTQLRASPTQDVGFSEVGFPAYSDMFACRKLSLRGPREYDLFPVDPGDYTAVAYTRVFATEESFALGQVLPERYQLDESLKQPGGVYLPGSFDCAVLETYGAMARACLPDVVTGAQVDKDRQIVSVMYDPSALPEPFDVTLVSEPFEVTLASWVDDQLAADDVYIDSGDLTRFASAADVVCGAVVNDYYGFDATGDSRFDFDSGRDDISIDAQFPALEEGGTHVVEARVMPWLAPDGSSVRLDAGALAAYMRFQGVSEVSGWPEYQVAGFAPLEMLGVIPHDRFRGPTSVQLRVGEPEWCPGIENDARLTSDTAVLGTWTVTPAEGPQTKHELLSGTGGWLPSPINVALDNQG